MYTCSVKGCIHECGKYKVKCRTFPKDINMLKKWIAATANELLLKVEVGKFRKYKICNLHFSDQYKLRPTFTSTDMPVPTVNIPVDVNDIDRIAEGINLPMPTETTEVIKKKDPYSNNYYPKFVVAKQYVQIDGESVKLIPKKSKVKSKPSKSKELNIEVENNLKKSLLVDGNKNEEEEKASIFANDGCKLHKNSKFIRIKASKKEALEKSGKYKIIRELKPIKKIQLDEDGVPKSKSVVNNGNDLNIADTLQDLDITNKSHSTLESKIVAIELLKQTNDLVSSKIAVNENGLPNMLSELTKKDVSNFEKGLNQFKNMENVPTVSTSETVAQVDLNQTTNLSLATDNLSKFDPQLDIQTVTVNDIITKITTNCETESKISDDNKIAQPKKGNGSSVTNPVKFIKIKASDISKIENSGKYKIVRTLTPPITIKKNRIVNKMGNSRFKFAKSKIMKKDACNPKITKEVVSTGKTSTYSAIANSSEESDMKITDISSQICPSKCMKLNIINEKDKIPNSKQPVKMLNSIRTQQIPSSTKIHNRNKNVIQLDPEAKMKMEIAKLKTRITYMENETKAKKQEMTTIKRKMRHLEKRSFFLKNKADSFKEFENFHLLDGQIQSFIRSQLNNMHREKFARVYTKLDKMLACSILNCSKPCYSLLSKIFIMPSVTKQLKTFNEDNIISEQNMTTINDGDLIYNVTYEMS